MQGTREPDEPEPLRVGPPSSSSSARRIVQFSEPYDPRELRERTRSWIARALVALLTVMTLVLLGFVGFGKVSVNEALAIQAPLTAVVGTALGFYFGGQKNGD